MQPANRVRRFLKPPFRFGKIAETGSLAVALPRHPRTTFDERKFLYLLRASLSFSGLEKLGMIAAIAGFSQEQIDGAIAILEEEFVSWSAKDERFHKELEKAEKKAAVEWRQVSQTLNPARI